MATTAKQYEFLKDTSELAWDQNIFDCWAMGYSKYARTQLCASDQEEVMEHQDARMDDVDLANDISFKDAWGAGWDDAEACFQEICDERTDEG